MEQASEKVLRYFFDTADFRHITRSEAMRMNRIYYPNEIDYLTDNGYTKCTWRSVRVIELAFMYVGEYISNDHQTFNVNQLIKNNGTDH